MKIIGLNSGEFNSSKCLVIGKVVYAVQDFQEKNLLKNFHIIVLKNVLNLQI